MAAASRSWIAAAETQEPPASATRGAAPRSESKPVTVSSFAVLGSIFCASELRPGDGPSGLCPAAAVKPWLLLLLLLLLLPLLPPSPGTPSAPGCAATGCCCDVAAAAACDAAASWVWSCSTFACSLSATVRQPSATLRAAAADRPSPSVSAPASGARLSPREPPRLASRVAPHPSRHWQPPIRLDTTDTGLERRLSLAASKNSAESGRKSVRATASLQAGIGSRLSLAARERRRTCGPR